MTAPAVPPQVFVVWRGNDTAGVLVAPTEGEGRARLRVERGPDAQVVEVWPDWKIAYERSLIYAAGGPVDHEPDAACQCLNCLAYVEATCGHWRTRGLPFVADVRWCDDCTALLQHDVAELKVLDDGGVLRHRVLVKTSLRDPAGPAEFRLRDGTRLHVERAADVGPVVADL